MLKELVVGRDAVVAHIDSIYSNPHIVRSEYFDPAVHVSDSGDFAVPPEHVRARRQRQRAAAACVEATEAYRLIDGEWRIVHSNWAFTQTAEGAIAS